MDGNNTYNYNWGVPSSGGGQRDGLTFNWLKFVIGSAILVYLSWGRWSFTLYLAVVVLIHEMGHVLAGRAFGCGIKEMQVFFLSFLSYKPKWRRGGGAWSNITWSLGLLPLGGVTVFKSRPEGYGTHTSAAASPYINDKPAWQRLVISAGGVLMNFATFLVLYFVMPSPSAGWFDICWTLSFLSLVLAILNILPVYPLDGGAIIFAFYEMISGRKPSQQFVNICGIVGFALIVIFFWIYPDWIERLIAPLLRVFF